MRTDGLFTLRKINIPCKNGDEFRLIPFGDVHRDSPAHSDDMWTKFLERAKSVRKPLFLGMGDYWDSYSASERLIIGDPGIHESTAKRMEREAYGRIAGLVKELSFMRGRLLGLLSGNHFISFRDGVTSDMILAQRLSTQFLGVCSAIRIKFKMSKNDNSKVACVDIFAHHGTGLGTTAGGKMNAAEKMATTCEADIFLMGHNHARGVLPLGDKLRIAENSRGVFLRARHAFIGRTGSFLRAYVDGESSYVVERALQPASLGWIELILKVKREREGGKDTLSVEIGSQQ